MKEKETIAIIGAGLSGLSLAQMLGADADVTIFDKSRGIGGRMSTRYSGDYQFDHGAQFFTARSSAFRRFLEPFMQSGIVQDWTPHVMTLGDAKKPYKRDWFEPHYTAAPKMNMLCKALAADKQMVLNTEVQSLEQSKQGWMIKTKDSEYGAFDWVVSTAPAPQAANLMPAAFAHHDAIAQAKMVGCYSLMLGFDQAIETSWQASVVKNSPIGWICVDSSKPERGAAYSLLVQSTNDWAELHLEDDQGEVQRILIAELERLLGQTLPEPDYTSLHRWRYANTQSAPEPDFLVDEDLNIGVCGDWFKDGHVESAFLSALALYEHLTRKLEA